MKLHGPAPQRRSVTAGIPADAGYTNVWNQVEGLEGDMDNATGARDLNGWRNAGLPWTYDLRQIVAAPEAE